MTRCHIATCADAVWPSSAVICPHAKEEKDAEV